LALKVLRWCDFGFAAHPAAKANLTCPMTFEAKLS
jgi:hypothetical protein